ncbi:MAG TPA: hypothetical protein VLT13_11875, partial [Bacteroidota bacterium]|nr:hypothetical protein [Bacteroidota bacterium]
EKGAVKQSKRNVRRSRTDAERRGAGGGALSDNEQSSPGSTSPESNQPTELYARFTGSEERGVFRRLIQTTPVRLIAAEVRCIFKGQRWWWYVVTLGLVIGGLVSSPETARRYLLPAAWLWPVLVLSALGTREERCGTRQMVFSSPHPVTRQLPAAWIGGVIAMLLCGSGVGLNLLVSAEWPAFGAWCAGALFVPSLALALGVWSQTNRLFEIVYVLIWYLGPVHPLEMPGLDFMGAADASIAAGVPALVAVAGVLFVLLAMAGRWVRMRSSWSI